MAEKRHAPPSGYCYNMYNAGRTGRHTRCIAEAPTGLAPLTPKYDMVASQKHSLGAWLTSTPATYRAEAVRDDLGLAGVAGDEGDAAVVNENLLPWLNVA